MCCKLDTCCFCIDLRGGVKALGVILALLSLLSLIFTVVQVENQRQDYLACAEKAALSSAGNEIKCGDGKITIKRENAQAKIPHLSLLHPTVILIEF